MLALLARAKSGDKEVEKYFILVFFIGVAIESFISNMMF